MEPKKLDSRQAFDRTTASGVCLVDFGAPWCGPCSVQAPIVRRLAEAFSGRATVAEVDISVNREVAERLGIHSIPTLIIFRDGNETRRFVGMQPERVLAGALDETIEPYQSIEEVKHV